jgi:tRNA(fMet)-specific endonuclease VapC
VKYLLDTCAISDFVKGNNAVLARIKKTQPQQLAISTVTVMEIEYGLKLHPGKAKRIRPVINGLISALHILPYTQQQAETTAEIRASLKQQGTPIGPYDLMISATAMAQKLIMVTSNTREFERISGLQLEDWRYE